MKFLPVVEEMAETSPMCSIMAAMAMGAMTRMEVTSNLAMTNFCRPTKSALLTEAKLIRGCMTPSAPGSFAPQAVAISATMYAPTTPSRMGMILIMPLPQMLATMMMAMATRASHQQVEALVTAVPDRFRPMRMMMGPVTMGGK